MALSSRYTATAGDLPTSATVLDFICLFTHDLKRKQKRWQDGALKYHTFNKRIMVYDDRGHFIGDAHWQSDGHLAEGDEFALDRGGALVQVSDCTGQREQDLTELIDKRAKEVEKRRANAASRTPRQGGIGVTPIPQDQSSHFQLRHRPLSSLVGTPSRIGRALIPQRSPYEARQIAQTSEQTAALEDSRPQKRMRHERSPDSKSSHARSLFGATLTLSAQPLSTPVSRTQVSQIRTNVEVEVQKASSKAALRDEQQAASNSLPQPAHCQIAVAKKCINNLVIPARPSGALAQSTHGDDAEDAVVLSDDWTPPSSCNRAQPLPQPSEEHSLRDLQRPCNDSIDKPIRTENAFDSRRKGNALGRLKLSRIVPPEEDMIQGTGKEGSKKPPAVKETSGAVTNEPRTELRIRSRKRRGLLMMSENNIRNQGNAAGDSVFDINDPTGSQEQETLEPLIQDHLGHLVRKDSRQARDISSCSETPDIPQLGHSDLEDTDPQPVDDETEDSLVVENANKESLLSLGMGIDSTTRKSRIECESSDDEQPVRPRGSRSTGNKDRLRKRTRCVMSDDEAECPERDSSPRSQKSRKSHHGDQNSTTTPRITRMARKSVKSREIIGFVAPSHEYVFADAFSTGSNLSGENSHRVSDQTDATSKLPIDEQNAQAQAKGSMKAVPPIKNVPSIDQSDSKSRPKLSNPATKGRKAARKEDAAGQPPRTIVQFEMLAPQRTRAITAVAPGNETLLPGFVRANGGAWSRHAEDLLGMTRPTAKVAR